MYLGRLATVHPKQFSASYCCLPVLAVARHVLQSFVQCIEIRGVKPAVNYQTSRLENTDVNFQQYQAGEHAHALQRQYGCDQKLPMQLSSAKPVRLFVQHCQAGLAHSLSQQTLTVTLSQPTVTLSAQCML